MTQRRLLLACELKDNQSKGINEADLFIVKHEGVITVYRNRCPHLGTPMEFMPDQFLSFDKSFVHCSTHGALFEHGTGLCVSGPCSGQHLTIVPHEVVDGWICI